MPTDWQQLRAPEEVPTPVAVAVSDFCRRARAPAGAQEVREALSTLSEGDDFRVRELTDGEPEASPLGPYAVVDVLKGTPQAVAARRQEVGYYELVREVVALRQAPPPPPAEQVSVPPAGPLAGAPGPAREAPAAVPSRATEPARPAAPARPATVAERIAPKRRVAREAEPAAFAEEDDRRRELPRPRGRFTNVAPPRTPISALVSPAERETLEALLAQHPHRFSLLRALAREYSGPRGELTRQDVEWVLEEHALGEALETREREHLLEAYTAQRGANGRVGWALGLSPSELEALIGALGLRDQVEELRERYRREALAPRTLTARLDLLGRDKYLTDLGIRKRFRDALTADLRAALARAREGAADAAEVVGRVAREFGAPVELLQRAIERLGLQGELRTSPPQSPVP